MTHRTSKRITDQPAIQSARPTTRVSKTTASKTKKKLTQKEATQKEVTQKEEKDVYLFDPYQQ